MNPLQAIDVPADLRRLTHAQLGTLAQHCHATLAAADDAAVELALALHYVFHAPRDRIVWDGGGGQHGFDSAHASTALSAACGVARAIRLQGADAHAVAVIGNDAMGAGMAFEALNNAGVAPDARLLVVLADDALSNPAPGGALQRTLQRSFARLLVRRFAAARAAGDAMLPGPVRALARRVERHARDIALPPAAIFEAFGFRHAGPVDGHDLATLVPILEDLRRRTGPHLLHVVTRTRPRASPRADMDGLDDWLCAMAATDPRLVAVTPARRGAARLARFAQAFPHRYFDVGVADQHAVTFAAGLATEGLKPVVAIQSTYLQRAYDQLIHDVALQRLDVTFAIGGTGDYDAAFLRCVPNMVLMAPSDDGECRRMLAMALRHAGPAAVRLPCGWRSGGAAEAGTEGVEIGRALVRRTGARTAILAFGPTVAASLGAGRALDATVVDMRFIKPLDTGLLLRLAREHDRLVTVAEGPETGGAGAAVAEALAAAGLAVPLLMLGRLDADGIVRALRRRFPPGQEKQVANDG